MCGSRMPYVLPLGGSHLVSSELPPLALLASPERHILIFDLRRPVCRMPVVSCETHPPSVSSETRLGPCPGDIEEPVFGRQF